MAIFSRDANKLIDDIYKPVKNLGKYSEDIEGQKFGKLTVIFPVQNTCIKCKTINWICLCECGNYYRVLPSKLIQGKITCCPVCNDGVMTDDGRVIHPINKTARKTDQELAELIAEDFYIYFKDYIEVEDFVQEIHCIFALNRYNKRSRTWGLNYYLRDLKCRLRGYYKHPIKYSFESYDNLELIVDNYFDYIDVYPLDKKLNIYIDKYLTKKEQKTLHMYFEENLSIIQIAKILGISKQMVSQNKINAINKLRKKLK